MLVEGACRSALCPALQHEKIGAFDHAVTLSLLTHGPSRLPPCPLTQATGNAVMGAMTNALLPTFLAKCFTPTAAAPTQ